MLTTLLKEHTKEEHASLEKKLVSFLKRITSTSDYLKVLDLFYGYYEGLEKKVEQFVDKDLLPDYPKRRKSNLILNDIKTINPYHEIPGCPYLPEINNLYAALGALYVIEGSSLGGQVISKMISEKLKLSNNDCLSFFRGYENQTLHMWNVFKLQLNSLPLLASQQEQVLSAARETFIKFEECFDKHNSNEWQIGIFR